MYTWKDELRTGHEEIDEQHRMMFMICDRIERNFEDGDEAKKKRTTMEGIKYLKEYTLHHFETEERLQQSVDYADYEDHKRVHDHLREMVHKYEKELEESDYDQETVSRLLEMVKEWLFDHIMGMDQRIPKR